MVYECLRLPYQSAFHVYVNLPYMDPKGYGKTRSSKYRTWRSIVWNSKTFCESRRFLGVPNFMKKNLGIPINFGNSHHSLHGSYRICTLFNKDSHLQGWNEFIPERSRGTTILAKSKALEVHRNDNDHTNLPGKGPRKTPLKRYTNTWKMNGRNLQPSPGNCLQPSGETYSPKNL